LRVQITLVCLFCLLSGCKNPPLSPVPDQNDATNSQDTGSTPDALDVHKVQDFIESEDAGGDVNTVEDPCIWGHPPSIKLGRMQGVDSFAPFKNGDPLPFEFGTQGGSMIVADLLHLGTAGLNGSMTIQVFNADTGASLITFEQSIMGSGQNEEGLENPMWMCIADLGNVIPDLWLSSWEDLPHEQAALMQAYVSFESEPGLPPLVLSFEVEGTLTYTP
jgi:hypothetical protein